MQLGITFLFAKIGGINAMKLKEYSGFPRRMNQTVWTRGSSLPIPEDSLENWRIEGIEKETPVKKSYIKVGSIDINYESTFIISLEDERHRATIEQQALNNIHKTLEELGNNEVEFPVT